MALAGRFCGGSHTAVLINTSVCLLSIACTQLDSLLIPASHEQVMLCGRSMWAQGPLRWATWVWWSGGRLAVDWAGVPWAGVPCLGVEVKVEGAGAIDCSW